MDKKPSIRFREIIKVFARYGFGYIFDSKNIEDKKSPENLRKAFEDLGPTFIKIGQIFSTRPDLFPKEYIEELTKLQDSAPEESFENMQLVIDKSLHIDINNFFECINPIPIASASIAQVYEGELKDGRKVVIKIQRADIYKKMQLDISILKRILKFTKARIKISVMDPVEALKEIESVAKDELDFRLEAQNIIKFREYNKNIASVYAPYVVEELSSDKVLVLEKINGIKINELNVLGKNGYDIKDIANKLALAYCKQIFEDGFFHGDPHPGNILISNGKICFVDFGIVGQLSDVMKKWLNSAMFAVATKDKEKLVDCILSVGIKNGKINRIALYESVSYIFDIYLKTSIKNIMISNLIQEICDITRDNNIQLPRELVSLIRGLLILEGVVAKIDPELEIIDVIVRFMKSRNKFIILDYLEKEELLVSLYSFARDGIKIPTKTLEVLNKISAGEAKLELKVSDIDKTLIQVHRMVNRITEGLLISTLILSSSLIISNNVRPTYKGISIIGLVGYSIATVFAINLLRSMVKSCDR